MSASRKLDTQTETQVVAMIARGDKYPAIVDWIKENKGVDISIPTLTSIKNRNQEAIKFMTSEMVKHETTIATNILSKSRQLIDRKLNQAIKVDEELANLKNQLNNGEISDEEYYQRADVVMRQQLSVKELNSISKESFNQSQIESGKPTAISENPAQAKANLAILLNAIKDRDDTTALKAIFPDD